MKLTWPPSLRAMLPMLCCGIVGIGCKEHQIASLPASIPFSSPPYPKRPVSIKKTILRPVRYTLTPLPGMNMSDGVFFNNNGMVAGSDSDLGGKVWRNGKTWTIHNPLHDSMYDKTCVSGINDAGTVIGTFRSEYDSAWLVYYAKVFVWHSGRVTVLPPTDKSANSVPSAVGVSKTGDVLVRVTLQSPSSDDEEHKTYLYHAGKYQLLPQNEYQPKSDKGLFRENSQGEFVPVADPIPIPLFSGAVYEMLDVNRAGIGVGSVSEATSSSQTIEELSMLQANEENDTITRAYVWRNGTTVDLNTLISTPSGWILSEADAINNRGQIVCTGNKGGCLLTPIATKTH